MFSRNTDDPCEIRGNFCEGGAIKCGQSASGSQQSMGCDIHDPVSSVYGQESPGRVCEFVYLDLCRVHAIKHRPKCEVHEAVIVGLHDVKKILGIGEAYDPKVSHGEERYGGQGYVPSRYSPSI